MTWRPLLEGSEAEAALRLARAIACEVAGVGDAVVDRALFWAYASDAFDEPFAHAAYDAALAQLVEVVLAGASHAGLYNDGLAGMGWVLAHVTDDDELLAQIDRALLDVAGPAYDLTHGVVGTGVYFLERLRAGAPIAREGLDRVVAHLAATAERTADGARWLTRPELMQPHVRALRPHGHHDCGVAHGSAGVIAFLARVESPEARALCDDAARWLIAQRGEPGALGGHFPAFVVPGVPVEASRSAWCYGDLGVAAALWRVDPQLARETALDGIARPTAHCAIEDVALCHGTAGIGHLYNRFYQATREPAFGEAARRWFGATVVTASPAELPGYALWGAHWPRLVDGAMGVALALIAAATGTEPGWDRLMLCDLP